MFNDYEEVNKEGTDLRECAYAGIRNHGGVVDILEGRRMMRAEEPRLSDTGRYTMTEASNALGIHRNTLRRYWQQGKLKATYRKMDGRKLFTGFELKKLWRIAL